MSSFTKTIAAAATLLVVASCSTPKNVVYFQDVHPGTVLRTDVKSQILIQPKDELFINVTCSDERLTEQFNLSRGSGNVMNEGSASFLGYLVDSNGNIDFPLLGSLHVAGMTREEVATYIKQQLQTSDLVKDLVVTVKFLNLGVVVLGEVKNPGRVPIERDKLTILDAIAQVGDLTINGVRTNVIIIRDEGAEQKVYEVDLTDAASVYSSPVYYLQQEDVIYVEPNASAIRASTANGNTLQTYTFWMSLITFALSIGAIVLK